MSNEVTSQNMPDERTQFTALLFIDFPTESRPLHDALRQKARTKDFASRNLYATRSAISLRAFGVTEFATANVKDFEAFGFERVWNPVAV